MATDDETVEHRNIGESNTESLARLMNLEPEREGLWGPGELGEILAHQLSASLEFDLLGLDENLVHKLRTEWASDPPIETFSDLLHHPCPPVEFLELTKQFAKASRSHPDSPLPDEVAAVLHLLSVVVARTKCDRRITGLSDEGLRFSLEWALEQSWIDDSTRSLLKEGRKAVEAPA
jgi:hypothetical protein